MPNPRRITFAPDQMDELENEKQRRSLDGFAIREIHNTDGSVTLILTPPETIVDADTDSESAPSQTRSESGSLAWGAKVSEGFRDKVRATAADLGCDPDFLMAAMAFETGETFSPKIRNPQSGATGLIQFMPNTARALGTTTNDLANMSAEDQLDFVGRYFDDHKGRLHTLEDVYMAILWPAAIGRENDYVLFARPLQAYEQNKGLDSNKDGKVTKAEAAAKVRAKLEKGRMPGNAG